MSHHIHSVSQSDAMIQYQDYLARREAARRAERDERVRREARMRAFDAAINAAQNDDGSQPQDEESGKDRQEEDAGKNKEPEEDPGNGLGTYWA
jgi:hypothetical protein